MKPSRNPPYRRRAAVLGLLAASLFLAPAGAAESDPTPLKVGASGLPVPRFVSLGAREVNMRTGPGTQYPIKWLYGRRGLPVLVEAEYDIWRKVRDRDGEVGWIHGSLLSGRRTVVIAGGREGVRTLYESPHPASVPVLRAEDGVIGDLDGCRLGWCKIKIEGKSGWLTMDALWGVLPADDKPE
ncbi:MAG: hypothetical protein H3C28_08765 [Sphingomonadales bacterium]|nr:hypothetical protein [Sphingomonadales bacterium]